jgi:hypothetical protein
MFLKPRDLGITAATRAEMWQAAGSHSGALDRRAKSNANWGETVTMLVRFQLFCAAI